MKNKKNKPNKKDNYLIVIIVLLIIAIALTISAFFVLQNKEKKENIAYTELLKDIEENKVEKIEMTVGSTNLKVTYKEREKEEDTEKVIIPSTQGHFTERPGLHAEDQD